MSFYKRISFQSKVLLPVIALLVALPVFTVWTVDHHISQQSLKASRQTLSTANAVFRNSVEIRESNLISRFRNVVNEPRFKATAQLDDNLTMKGFLKDALIEYEDEVLFLIYTGKNSRQSVQVSREPFPDSESLPETTRAEITSAMNGTIHSGLHVLTNKATHVVSVPVALSERSAVIGVFTVGIELGGKAIDELRSLTQTELLLLHENRYLGGTLPLSEVDVKVMPGEVDWNHSDITSVVLAGIHYHLLGSELYPNHERGDTLRYLLLDSYEAQMAALQSTRTTLIGVSATCIALSVVIIWILIRRTTEPLRALRSGTELVAKGDFRQKVECNSSDEFGELATTFNQMTDSLQRSHHELNSTVEELQATQAQLIQREVRLRESEEGLRLIIEGARDHAIFTMDETGQIVRWNAAAERIMGYSAEEAGKLNYAKFFSQEDQFTGKHSQVIQSATKEGRTAFEGWRIRNDGSRFWADVTVSRLAPVGGANQALFVEITRDITSRKEAEEALHRARDAAESANRAKSEFLANMSHEIRTPMNGIIGMSNLLMDQGLHAEHREFAEIIRSSAESLLDIIDEILDIAKIESGKLELAARSFELKPFMTSVIEMFAPAFEDKGLELWLTIDKDTPRSVTMDSGRLRQILVNLIGNALKFTESGGVWIRVNAGDYEKNRLSFSIQDTGIGIPATAIDKVFDSFFQVESQASRRFGGTGLGLAISKRLIHLLEGEIQVESEVAQGSTFTFTTQFDACDSPSQTTPPIQSDLQIVVITDSDLAKSAIVHQLEQLQVIPVLISPEPESILKHDFSRSDCIILDDSAAYPEIISSITRNHAHGSTKIPLAYLSYRNNQNRIDPESWNKVLLKPLKIGALKHLIASIHHTEEGDRSDESETVVKQPVFDANFANHFPLQLLVVEDNLVNTKVLVTILKKLGYAPFTAENGKAGLEKIESHPIDMVFMDIQMPVMDGLEATRRIRAREPRPIFITAFTANARPEDREACQDCGMDEFVTKPARPAKIKEVLEKGYHHLNGLQTPS